MKHYLLELTFLLSTFVLAKPTTLREAISLLNDQTQSTISIDLANRGIGDKGARVLANAIQNNHTITNLKLDIESNEIGYEGATALANAIQKNNTISSLKLNLWYNQIGNEGATALANAIKNNNTIANLKLNLENNAIGNEGATALANAIQNNNTILSLKLNLWDNQIDNEGATALANAIQNNNTISSLKLDLWGNQIDNEGAQALANAIADNSTIANLKLHLENNQIDKIITTQIENTIQNTLKRNRKLTKFEKYFLALFKSKEFTDNTICKIPNHSVILKARLGEEAFSKLYEVLQGRSPETINIFFDWVYSGFTKTYNKESIQSICQELKINFEEKNGNAGFEKDMRNLYDSRDTTGNFTIIVSGEEIKAHKAILAARSKMLREMFLSAEEQSDKVTNRLEATPEEFNLLLKYIYTDQEPIAKPENWSELLEFYQVN